MQLILPPQGQPNAHVLQHAVRARGTSEKRADLRSDRLQEGRLGVAHDGGGKGLQAERNGHLLRGQRDEQRRQGQGDRATGRLIIGGYVNKRPVSVSELRAGGLDRPRQSKRSESQPRVTASRHTARQDRTIKGRVSDDRQRKAIRVDSRDRENQPGRDQERTRACVLRIRRTNVRGTRSGMGGTAGVVAGSAAAGLREHPEQ